MEIVGQEEVRESRITKPYKLVSREMHEHDTVIRMPRGTFGEHHFTIIAGPCSVENEATILRTADWLMAHGIRFLRAGAFKPRTSPYAFQGLGHEGLFPIIAATRSTFRLFRRPERFAICRSWWIPATGPAAAITCHPWLWPPGPPAPAVS
jgi:3-deoxy-D-arabino-heptulosonate 7-phosphate (DAHP) synthase